MRRYNIRSLAILTVIILAASVAACDRLIEPVNKDSVQELSLITEAELEGTTWLLVNFGPADNPQAALKDSEMAVRFNNYEDLSGFTGCNYYGKHFEIDELQLITTELERTRFSCSDEAVMTQDEEAMDALRTIDTIGLDGDFLIIGYAVGEMRFEKVPPPSITPLTDTDWLLTEMVLGGEILPILEGALITASFREGLMSGGSGCNSYGGEYELNSTGFSIDEIAQTAELCLDEALMEQENAFIDILWNATDYRLDGDMLIIGHAGGELQFQQNSS